MTYVPEGGIAVFSLDRVHRYTLWRGANGDDWRNPELPYVQFIGLNPSTADERTDDATVRKCMRFAQSWGYRRMVMTNVFSFRATDKRVMLACANPDDGANLSWVRWAARRAKLVVACWGQDGNHRGQADRVRAMLSVDAVNPLYYLRLGKREPCHPLYLPGRLTPTLWEAR